MKAKQRKYKPNHILNIGRARLWRWNQSWCVAIVGPLGSGKSWTALALADYTMNGRFDPEKFVFFKIEDFIHAVVEGEIKRGDCVVLDEAGISFSSRESMSRKNKALSAIFQIMRYKNFGLIMTVPVLKLIDKTGRDILNTVIETQHINRKEGYAVCKLKICQLNALLGKTYRKFAHGLSKGRKKGKVKRIRIQLPDVAITNKYEKMKRDFAESPDGLFSQIEGKINAMPQEVEETNVEPNVYCIKCGYTWFTNSNAIKPQCPSCRSTKTARMRIKT